MAGMGKTGTVNITPEMMDEAIKAIQAYRTTAFGAADGNGSDGLYGTVKKEVETLTASDFTGSASKGFVNFYTNNIEPATGSRSSHRRNRKTRTGSVKKRRKRAGIQVCRWCLWERRILAVPYSMT